MVDRRRAIAVAVGLALGVSASLLAQKIDKKQEEAQKREGPAVYKAIDSLTAGQPAPNDLDLKWTREDFLKAQGNRTYVPFIVTVDPSKVTGGSLALYLRVAATAGAPASQTSAEPARNDKDKKDKDKDKKSEYAWEEMAFLPVAGGKPGPMQVARSFTVPAGSYDVYVIVKEPIPEKTPRNAPPPKMSVLKQTVNAPDFWNGELSTSTVILAQRVDPLPAPLTAQQQAERPYAMGSLEVVPKTDTTFSKDKELQPIFIVYNPKLDSANKPNVTIDYNFYQKPGGAAEKFFNKTEPQIFNAETMPQFDIAAGHQIPGGLAVPLRSFPEGDYRLEIKVTDKIANKTLTRDVNFTVTAS